MIELQNGKEHFKKKHCCRVTLKIVTVQYLISMKKRVTL